MFSQNLFPTCLQHLPQGTQLMTTCLPRCSSQKHEVIPWTLHSSLHTTSNWSANLTGSHYNRWPYPPLSLQSESPLFFLPGLLYLPPNWFSAQNNPVASLLTQCKSQSPHSEPQDPSSLWILHSGSWTSLAFLKHTSFLASRPLPCLSLSLECFSLGYLHGLSPSLLHIFAKLPPSQWGFSCPLYLWILPTCSFEAGCFICFWFVCFCTFFCLIFSACMCSINIC